MASTFSVSTAFKAQDKMSSVFKKMGKSSSVFGSVLKANIAGAAIQKGFSLLVGGLRTVTTEFIEFEGSLIEAGAKFADVNAATEEGQRQIKQLGVVAREVGATTKFSATEAASGLSFLAMAGFTSVEAMSALPRVTDLAVVAQTDLATATDIASDSLGAFGLEVEDLGRLNDVMAKTMTTSNTNMVDMFEAIKKGAPAFTAAGQSLETFNSFLGVMANSGIKGSEAGTSLRNVMLRLADPAADAAKVMNDLGIVTSDQSGNFLDVIDILKQFEKGLEGMGSQQRTAALATVFGARSVTGINVLLAEGSEALEEYRNKLLGASGASGEMAAVIGQSLGNRLATLRSALIDTGFSFVEVFQDKAGATIDRLTETVKKVDLGSLAVGLDNMINRVIDNLPIMKQQFEEMLPQIKEFAMQMGQIVGFIADGIQKLAAIGSGPTFKVIKFLAQGGVIGAIQRRVAGDDEGTEAPNAREEEARAQTTTTNINIALARELSLAAQSQNRNAPNINVTTLGINQ